MDNEEKHYEVCCEVVLHVDAESEEDAAFEAEMDIKGLLSPCEVDCTDVYELED